MTRMQRSGSQSLETVYSYGAGNLLTRKTTRFSDRRYEQQAEYNKNNQPTSYVLKQNGCAGTRRITRMTGWAE